MKGKPLIPILLTLLAGSLYFATAQTLAGNLKNFDYSFVSINDQNAEKFLVQKKGVITRYHTDGPDCLMYRNGEHIKLKHPLSYYGPSENEVEGSLTYQFSFNGSTVRAEVMASITAYGHKNTNEYGQVSLWCSKDGTTWIKLRTVTSPAQGGKGTVAKYKIPTEALGTDCLFIQIRLLALDQSSRSNARFGQSYSNSVDENFSLKVEYLEQVSLPKEGLSMPKAPQTAPGTPPDPDYKDTIAELKRLLAEKDKKLAHCETEMVAKEKQTGELISINEKLQGEVKSLNGKVNGLETDVTTLKNDNEGLKGQIQNLREDNQNISYELTVTNEHLEEAITVAETPFINGWVYDPARGWIFTDAEHFPLVYTHNDESWNYYELGSSDPRYFFNYTTQEWVAWDTVPQEVEQTVAANTNL